jgi:hypothetical protein
MFLNQLVMLMYGTKDIRAALGCEAHCGNCPFQGLNEKCPGRVLQNYIDDAKKKIQEG